MLSIGAGSRSGLGDGSARSIAGACGALPRRRSGSGLIGLKLGKLGGIFLLGFCLCLAAERLGLRPVMRLKSCVSTIKVLDPDTTVSYGRTFRTEGKTRMGVLPIGYADGLARELSNNMDVLVNGRRARQVGNICMDQFMLAVDVNSTRSYKPTGPVEAGDVVTLIGTDGDERITADEMAAQRRTINYEVVCDFGMRLQKIYT